jgi:hypothetical protein
MTDFEPWEIPTGGEPPQLQLVIDEEPDGMRVAFNHSAWMLLVARANGSFEPLGVGAGIRLGPGDEVRLPESACEHVDSKVVFRTQLDGIREHHEAHRARFDPDTYERLPEESLPPGRWWWYRRELEHGRVLHLQQASSNARLSVSRVGLPVFEGEWCYPNHTDGWRAALGWNGWRDPPDGWIRHLQTARRRKDGTPESEYWQAADAPPWARKRQARAR